MITDAILYVVALGKVLFINLLPSFSFPANMLGSFAEAVSWVRVLGFYIPLDTIVICILAYLTSWLICIVISAILKVL